MADEGKKEKKAVVFSPEQMDVINEMFKNYSKDSKMGRSPNEPISMYGLRDPKTISTVNVSRFDGHWVLGFKNHQSDPYKKFPQYYKLGILIDGDRKLNNQPYVTLLLTDDGEKVEEKEVPLGTYLENRGLERLDVIDAKVTPVIHDHGILGSSGNYAVAVNDKGNPESRPTIKAESKSEERTFLVHPEGFKEPYWYHTDFLG